MIKTANFHRQLLRVAAFFLCCLMVVSSLEIDAWAAGERQITLNQAQNLAISSSKEISKQNNQIILKRMKYVEAVEGIKAKIKNLRSFRWSPLLSFKFPQQLNLTEEYDLNIKPLTLQTEIDNLVHGLNDLRYEMIHKVNQQFFETYYLQQSSEFTQLRLTEAQRQLRRNQASLANGNATQTDVDRAKSSVETLNNELSAQLRDFESAKVGLSDLIDIDVTTGYRFSNGFKSAFIPREALDSLITYTLDNDQAFYETKAATSTALLNLESYEDFMRSEYGKKMNIIQSYINAAKNGNDIDYAAFQIKYREMLKALDKPWSGKIRILFFRFTMEWFKGEIDGTRYIEDEMYAVYTACMEYGNAKREQEMAEKALRTQVKDSYESLVTAWNSYQNLKKLTEKSQQTLERVLTLNRLGKATYEETADEQTAYQDAQMDELDALKAYNDMLSEFDRLTCGAVTKYMKSESLKQDAGKSGDAYSMLDPINDPYYYIYSSVADLTFYIGVEIPDDFEPIIDFFEIWYGGTQIGERTQVGTELRHLMLDYKDTNNLVIRLYNGDEFVDECEINATVPRDVLDIAKADLTPQPRVVGSYTVTTALQGDVSVSTLKLNINAAEGADTYTLSYGDKGIYTTERRTIKEEFSYLSLMITSLDEVRGTLYDTSGEKLTDIAFDTTLQQLVTVVE